MVYLCFTLEGLAELIRKFAPFRVSIALSQTQLALVDRVKTVFMQGRPPKSIHHCTQARLVKTFLCVVPIVSKRRIHCRRHSSPSQHAPSQSSEEPPSNLNQQHRHQPFRHLGSASASAFGARCGPAHSNLQQPMLVGMGPIHETFHENASTGDEFPMGSKPTVQPPKQRQQRIPPLRQRFRLRATAAQRLPRCQERLSLRVVLLRVQLAAHPRLQPTRRWSRAGDHDEAGL